MCENKNNQNKIDALTDNMVSCLKIHEELDKKLSKRIRLMPEIKKKYDFVAKDETSVEANYFCDGFVEGAEWRINSIWHDASEKPQDLRMLVVIIKDVFPLVCGPNNTHWGGTVKELEVAKWAYIDDLLPIKEDKQ